jgi:hypothetical protein
MLARFRIFFVYSVAAGTEETAMRGGTPMDKIVVMWR